MALGSKGAHSGGNASVPLDAEVQALTLEQSKTQARRAIAEAQQATLEAELPSPQSKPRNGTVEIGNKTGLVAGIVARALVEEGVREIVQAVTNFLRDTTTLVVDDRALIATDWCYAMVRRELQAQLQSLATALRFFASDAQPDQRRFGSPGPAIAAPALLTAMTSAPAVFGSAADIAGMFRASHAVSAAEGAIDTTPLIAGVAGALHSQACDVIVDGFQLAEGQIIEDFFAARADRVTLEARLLAAQQESEPAERSIDDLRNQLTDAGTAYDKALGEVPEPPGLEYLRQHVERLQSDLLDAEHEIAPLRAWVAAGQAAITIWDAFAAVVAIPAAGEPYPPLVAAALRERLHGGEKPVRHVLYVGLEGAGGETITRRSLLRTPRKVGIVVGAQLSWLLLSTASGELVAAGSKPLLGQLTYDLEDPSLTNFRRMFPQWRRS